MESRHIFIENRQKIGFLHILSYTASVPSTNTDTTYVDIETQGGDLMFSQKWIENRILELLEKNEFLSGRDFYEKM